MAEKSRPWREAWRDRVRGGAAVWQVAFRADPRALTVTIAMAAMTAVTAPLFAMALRSLTDGVVSGTTRPVVVAVLLYAAQLTAGQLAAHLNFPARMRVMERSSHAIDQELMRLAGGAPGLEHMERPDYADRIELLRGSRRQLGQVSDAIVWNLQTILQLLTTTVVLAGAHPLLMLLPLFALPALVISQRTVWSLEELQQRLAERARTRIHLFKTALSPVAAKEVRVFGMQGALLDRYDALWRSTEREVVRVNASFQAKNIAAWMVFACGYIGAISLVARDAVEGRASAGDVVLAITLASQIRQQMTSVYQMIQWATQVLVGCERFGWLRSHAIEAAEAATPADPRPVPARLVDGITFDRVTFGYPSTEADVLRDVSIHLPAGSTIAVVGDNGAGKSTLVKLLARFYDPSEGCILVDGVDLRDLDVDEWRARLSAGFQDFARFELAVREVVGIGDLDMLDDVAAVTGALDRASANDVTSDLPDGLDTLVGKSFEGGHDLSGGQWQKLALGRAMMREAPLLLLLDEPTAALDAQTEHRLFERYAGAARRAAGATGAITLLVSHRFSTVRMADLILVVDGNGIAEAGSHEELMGLHGVYAELYELQARAYR